MKQRVLIIGTVLATVLFVLLGRFTNVPLGFGGQRIAFEFAILGCAAAALGPAPRRPWALCPASAWALSACSS